MRIQSIVGILSGIFLVQSAMGEDDTTLDAVAAGEEDLTTLVAALTIANLIPALQNMEASLTVFAPTNEAFTDFPEKFLDPQWILHLTDILLFHVAPGLYTSSNVTDGLEIDTLLEMSGPVTVQVDDEGVKFSGLTFGPSNLLVADLIASNGVIHKIDAWFTPSFLLFDTWDLLPLIDGIGNFTALLTQAGLEQAIQEDAITVLAPTDEAFGILDPALLEVLTSNSTLLSDLLAKHIILGVYPQDSLLDGQSLTTINNITLEVTLTRNDGAMEYQIDGVAIMLGDVLANNGILHTLSGILVDATPLPTLDAVAADEEDLTVLVTALTAANLISTLQDPEISYTVFAPTDEAFSNFPSKYLEPGWILHLTNTLLYHVSRSSVTSDLLFTGMTIDTITGQGAAILVNITDDGVFFSSFAFGPSNVVQADLLASNGVIHKVDSIFIPPFMEFDLFDLAQMIESFSFLADLIVQAGLEGSLQQDGITLFAPDDNSFASLSEEFLGQLSSNEEFLTAFLLLHIVPGLYPRDSLEDGQLLTTANNETLIFTVTGMGRFAEYAINGVAIQIPDQIASNGIVHIIVGLIPMETTPETDAPEAAPTFAPVTLAETESPEESPSTTAPISTTTSAPTMAPSFTAPISTTTSAPTMAPSFTAPISTTTSAPTMAPSFTAPISTTTSAPTMAPSFTAPISTTTSAPTMAPSFTAPISTTTSAPTMAPSFRNTSSSWRHYYPNVGYVLALIGAGLLV